MSVRLELAIILKLELWLGLGLGLGAWSVMLEIHVGSSGSSEAGASEAMVEEVIGSRLRLSSYLVIEVHARDRLLL